MFSSFNSQVGISKLFNQNFEQKLQKLVLSTFQTQLPHSDVPRKTLRLRALPTGQWRSGERLTRIVIYYSTIRSIRLLAPATEKHVSTEVGALHRELQTHVVWIATWRQVQRFNVDKTGKNLPVHLCDTSAGKWQLRVIYQWRFVS